MMCCTQALACDCFKFPLGPIFSRRGELYAGERKRDVWNWQVKTANHRTLSTFFRGRHDHCITRVTSTLLPSTRYF